MSASSQPHYLTERPAPALIRASGATVTILVYAADSGGAIGVIVTVFAPGDGVPFHKHSREDETFYVVSGTSGQHEPSQGLRSRPRAAPRCGSRTRTGRPWQGPAMLNGRLPDARRKQHWASPRIPSAFFCCGITPPGVSVSPGGTPLSHT
jgi:hypothetical protein